MKAKKKADDLGTKLETAIVAMLDKVNGDDIDMELRLKVFDRGAKYWALKNKIADGSLGAGFRDEDDEQETI